MRTSVREQTFNCILNNREFLILHLSILIFVYKGFLRDGKCLTKTSQHLDLLEIHYYFRRNIEIHILVGHHLNPNLKNVSYCTEHIYPWKFFCFHKIQTLFHTKLVIHSNIAQNNPFNNPSDPHIVSDEKFPRKFLIHETKIPRKRYSQEPPFKIPPIVQAISFSITHWK